MHGSLFRDIYFLANDQLKFNNAAKACLVKLNIKNYSFSSNIHEYFVYTYIHTSQKVLFNKISLTLF